VFSTSSLAPEFERNNEAELFLSAGNSCQTNAQPGFGSHTERFAYYASLNGNRSNLGLPTSVPAPKWCNEISIPYLWVWRVCCPWNGGRREDPAALQTDRGTPR
jgi:hypothetical protein